MSKQEEKVCANCGYTSTEPFEDDVCPKCGKTFWKCNECGYTLTAAEPPEVCPATRRSAAGQGRSIHGYKAAIQIICGKG
jgi:rubrerythrin